MTLKSRKITIDMQQTLGQLVPLVLLLGIILCGVAACNTQQQPQSQRGTSHVLTGNEEIHALLIILGDDMNIRASVEKSESRLKKLMKRVSVHCPVQLTILKSKDELTGSVTKMSLVAGETDVDDEEDQGLITGKHVSDWFNDLHPAAEDTVLIYYNGHGELRDYDNAHVLKFARNEVPRDWLRTELEKKPGRLKMLITDTCSKKAGNPDEELVARHLSRIQGKGRRYTRNLFLEHTGFLDITAASREEYAWGDSENGGFFTASLIESFTEEADANGNRNGFLEWREVFNSAKAKTEQRFRKTDFRGTVYGSEGPEQKSQTPESFQLPIAQIPRGLSGTDSSATATLKVTSTPSGATVQLDGENIGKTPLQDRVDLGTQTQKSVTLGIEHEGYKSHVEQLPLTVGKLTLWEVALEKRPEEIETIATLDVTSTPSGATVLLDETGIGETWLPIGETPLREHKVNTGAQGKKTVKVGIELAGYKSRVVGITLQGGKSERLNFELIKLN